MLQLLRDHTYIQHMKMEKKKSNGENKKGFNIHRRYITFC